MVIKFRTSDVAITPADSDPKAIVYLIVLKGYRKFAAALPAHDIIDVEHKRLAILELV